MAKEIALGTGKHLKDDSTVGLKFDGDEVLVDGDDTGAGAIADAAISAHESANDHTDLHEHVNKSELDNITDAGSGIVISTAERNKVAAMDVVHYGDPLQTTVLLSAILEADCNDKERRFVEDELSDYFYDTTYAGGQPTDVPPDDQTGGTGFWRKVAIDGETAASIKTKYESNANTNEYSDAEKTKLGNVLGTGSGYIVSASERNLWNAPYITEYHVVTSGEVTTGYFELGWVPIDPQGLQIHEANGIIQVSKNASGLGSLVPDYHMLNQNQVHINNNGAATGLSENIVEGDILCIIYRRVIF